MASYKVPQDVEADDKIIGPFSFRQFIYLIIVALAGALAWWLGQISIVLIIIPLPVIIFFGALALPLRKDQPMEIYLAAMVSFYFKPHKRLWDPDGIESLIEVTAPKTVEVQRTKDFSQDEAQRRLSYLSEIVDSGGWAIRGVNGVQLPNSPMTSDAYFAAQQTEDILDEDNKITQTFDSKLEQSNAARHDAMTKVVAGQPTDYFNMPPAPSQTKVIPAPLPETFKTDDTISKPTPAPVVAADEPIKVDFNPYPDIQQSVIQPLADKEDNEDSESSRKAKPPIEKTSTDKTDTSDKPLPADIINLATNDNLSIATIAREANRIHEKLDMQEEVVISLR